MSEAITKALRMAIRQNEHDMLMTEDELRIARTALSQTAPSPQPAVPVVSDDGLISKDRFYGDDHVQDIAHALAQECEHAELDPNDYVTVNREKLVSIARRVMDKACAILALRPQAESKTYADGTTATGVAPLPDVSPAEQDAIQAESLLNDLEAMLGGRSGASIKLRSLIRSLRPAVESMTDEQIVQGQEQQGAQSILSFMKGVRFAEAHHGITAKAEGGV